MHVSIRSRPGSQEGLQPAPLPAPSSQTLGPKPGSPLGLCIISRVIPSANPIGSTFKTYSESNHFCCHPQVQVVVTSCFNSPCSFLQAVVTAARGILLRVKSDPIPPPPGALWWLPPFREQARTLTMAQNALYRLLLATSLMTSPTHSPPSAPATVDSWPFWTRRALFHAGLCTCSSAGVCGQALPASDVPEPACASRLENHCWLDIGSSGFVRVFTQQEVANTANQCLFFQEKETRPRLQ